MDNGRIVLELAPKKNNARNSEGAFYTLDNSILYIYTKYLSDDMGDDGYSCIAQRISDDDGETWSDDKILYRTEEHDAVNIMSVSLMKMENGDIGLHYLVRKTDEDLRLYLRRSNDNGKTWSDGQFCIDKKGYYVTNNDRLIRTASGRILMPSNLHEKTDDGYTHLPCISYSDDDGHTWSFLKCCEYAFLPNSNSKFQESGVIELKDKSIYQWMRTDMGRQYESYSHDDGLTWTYPVPSKFTSPNSPLSMKREPASGKLVAVYNPTPNYNFRDANPHSWGRTPLVLVVSSDEGKTWSKPLVLEDDPTHGYCYCAMLFNKDYLLLSYCSGGPDDKICLAKTTIRKIKISSFIELQK